MTWSFEAGPRQTIDLAGTFSNTEGLADAPDLRAVAVPEGWVSISP